MGELTASAFADFFKALWGREPFGWQSALAQRVLTHETNPWPEAVALPTAAGKTACMDIAVYCLAAQAERLGSSRPLAAPRRIFFVVDRRVIVDEAHQRAVKLAAKLGEAKQGILREVADRLRRLAGGDVPLAAFELRGGILRSDAWAKSPTQPLIVSGTVDQVGSRLLFRAYGPGHGMRPIHAGLVANDSLILLDEAHCAQPFLETLQAVKRYRGWAETPVPSPFWVTVMSATPPGGLEVFQDLSGEGEDPAHPLGKRQLASKRTRLLVAKQAKGKGKAQARQELANFLVEQARELVKQWENGSPDSPPAVVVFCNRVDTARLVYAKLVDLREDATLLTGRMRPIDKDDSVQTELDELSAERSPDRCLPQAKYVVATQTLEVGADLDFDLLVTECAGLDALRQRFGRLNRMGRAIPAQGVIVVRADQSEKSDEDPVYGASLAETWQWLVDQAEDGLVDFGIAELNKRLPVGDELFGLNAPSRHAPVLLPADVDALAQTSPEPWPSPEVALFLHGSESGPADVQVCWRADLIGDERVWAEILSRCPPSPPECLAVPFGKMRRWLAGVDGGDGGDVEGEAEGGETVVASGKAARIVVRWKGREQIDVLRGPDALRPGDVLVIPAALGGWDELGTLGRHPVADWGERAYAMMRDRAILRLHPEVLKQWPESQALQVLAETGPERIASDDREGLVDDLQSALSEWTVGLESPRWDWLKHLAENLGRDSRLARGIFPHPTGGLFILGTRRLNLHEMETASFSDEDDVSASGGSHAWLLPGPEGNGHLEGVAQLAGRHARLCGLSDELVEVLEAAGRGHDLGKADPRFQAWLRGGNPWVRGPLLAKSPGMPQGPEESRRARMRAGYPEGGRHELLSVRLLESAPEALPADDDLRDFLLHLVESHHGHCRPFAPVVDDPQPVQVTVESWGCTYSACSATGLERIDAGPAERFWRLTRRYGWWGLAWLEALLRLADHRRSEKETHQIEEGPRA
ncbi:MAG: type I-U CRISPR-associated helicase/endonuclease Cas3 [Deltaproteobacteria bacterium]|nr:type I-U CRISPR-associated helicase/endonuclease Cas3 [Deltaproteobacteria bacterium]